MKNLSTPLWRALKDDRDGHIICHIGNTGEKVLNGYDLEDSKRP
jgi:hypothetical protein